MCGTCGSVTFWLHYLLCKYPTWRAICFLGTQKLPHAHNHGLLEEALLLEREGDLCLLLKRLEGWTPEVPKKKLAEAALNQTGFQASLSQCLAYPEGKEMATVHVCLSPSSWGSPFCVLHIS